MLSLFVWPKVIKICSFYRNTDNKHSGFRFNFIKSDDKTTKSQIRPTPQHVTASQQSRYKHTHTLSLLHNHTQMIKQTNSHLSHTHITNSVSLTHTSTHTYCLSLSLTHTNKYTHTQLPFNLCNEIKLPIFNFLTLNQFSIRRWNWRQKLWVIRSKQDKSLHRSTLHKVDEWMILSQTKHLGIN